MLFVYKGSCSSRKPCIESILTCRHFWLLRGDKQRGCSSEDDNCPALHRSYVGTIQGAYKQCRRASWAAERSISDQQKVVLNLLPRACVYLRREPVLFWLLLGNLIRLAALQADSLYLVSGICRLRLHYISAKTEMALCNLPINVSQFLRLVGCRINWLPETEAPSSVEVVEGDDVEVIP